MNSPPTPPYYGSVAAALNLTNSPPTPPYCGSVAAALHLMNSQIRCGSCREKVYFCLSPCDGCNPTGGWCGSLKIRSLLGNFQPAQHQRIVRAVCIKRKVFSGFCLSFIRSISEHFARFMFKKSIHGQFVNNSWTLMFQKGGPFVFRPLSLCLLVS